LTPNPTIVTFRTMDTVAPTVSGLSPANGAVGVATAVTPVFRLLDSGDGVDTTTVQATVTASGSSPRTYTVANGGLTVSGTPADETFTIHPSGSFAQNTVISVQLQGADLHGNAMSPYTYSFTTADTSAPTITAVSPTASQTGIAI